jgi:hypothetical protein
MFRNALRKAMIAALTLVATSSAVFAASPGKVEAIGAFDDAGASAAIKAALDVKGYRLSIYDGSTVEVWFRKSVPVAKATDPNAVYPQLARSTFVGVIKFSRSAKDFRGQLIKPGAYAMRYELLPTDGNHMGCAAQPDFVLLTPLSSDADPNAEYDFAKLVELSGKASGTGHPAAFSLTPIEDVSSFPSLFYTSDGYVAFAAKAGTNSGELTLALVVKGVAQQ